MRKILLTVTILSVVLLAGCFGFFKKQEASKPSAPEVLMETSSSSQTSQAQIPEPPSFQDGDHYLQALASRSEQLCGSIKNEKLLEKCRRDVKAIVEQTQ